MIFKKFMNDAHDLCSKFWQLRNVFHTVLKHSKDQSHHAWTRTTQWTMNNEPNAAKPTVGPARKPTLPKCDVHCWTFAKRVHVTISILLPHVRSDISVRKTNTHSFIIDITGSSKSSENNLRQQKSHLVNIARGIISYTTDRPTGALLLLASVKIEDKNATDQWCVGWFAKTNEVWSRPAPS